MIITKDDYIENYNLYLELYYINNQKYEVISQERIKDIKFDYLIIAVTKYNMRISIKKNLLEKGIAQSKIADINTDLFTRENLDYIFNC